MALCARVRSLFQVTPVKRVRSCLLPGTASRRPTVTAATPTYQASPQRFLSCSPTMYSNEPMSHLLIRVASKEDMKAVSELTIAEGWGNSTDYVETLRQVNPDGFFLAFKGNELVGTACAFNYTDDLTFFGMSITKQGHRKQGIQRRLFEQRFSHAGDRNVACNSSDEHRINVLHKIGFKKTEMEMRLMIGQVDHSVLPKTSVPAEQIF
ncbi:holothin acyltransferase-like [Glandiceps talaboti]